MTSLQVVQSIRGGAHTMYESADILDQWFNERIKALTDNLLTAMADTVKAVERGPMLPGIEE